MTTAVGIVGAGRMGRAMALRLLAQGHEVRVYNRTPAAAQALLAQGARLARTPAEAAEGGLVLSTLTDEAAVHGVCTGPAGLLTALSGGTHLSTSTLSPAAAERLAGLHRAAGARYVSCPVQGRPPMAEAGQLVAWLSGPADDLRVDAVLQALARQTIRLGDDPRQAAAAKLALNLLMNANVALFAQAFAYVASRGVDPRTFGDGLSGTVFATPMFKAMAGALASGDDRPGGSDIAVSHKDLGLLLDDLGPAGEPLVQALAQVYGQAEQRGWGALDPTAVARLFKEKTA